MVPDILGGHMELLGRVGEVREVRGSLEEGLGEEEGTEGLEEEEPWDTARRDIW